MAPEGQGEAAIARFACDWLKSRGVRAWMEEAAPGRPNAVAEIGNAALPALVFCAHLDTVGVEGMEAPYCGESKEGRVYGRGAYDMKGSAAAIMAAAVDLARGGYNGRVLLALVADEEYASIGAMDFVKRHPASACIVTEPSEGKLILGHKGFVWAEIVTRGRAAHGSRWDLGISAIGDMARLATALEEFDREELRRRVHPLMGPASMHCALIQGGTGLSTYASECRMKVERRTLPGETAATVEQELKQVAAAAGVDAAIDCFFERSPLTCDRDERIAACVRDAAAAATGSEPEEAGVSYWMDAAIFAAAGIPTVNYGPAGAGAHETVEWVDVTSVATCSRVLADAARRFAAASNGSADMMSA
jgi:acetylornithine deacetylase